MVNIWIQSSALRSSFSVFGEKFSIMRTFASYSGGTCTPASIMVRSAALKNSRARSWRPRVAISTAWLTNSGRESISSCAMNDPIDTPTTRTGPPTSSSISVAVSATMVSVVNALAFSVAPTPRLSKVMVRNPARRKAGTWCRCQVRPAPPRPAMKSTGSPVPRSS